jgi:membrane protease YdiL (CAAX protease family)
MAQEPDRRRQIASIAEVLAVFILGNLLARSLLRIAVPAGLLATSFNPFDGNALMAAAGIALSLLVRFTILLALGFSLLWWFSRKSPREAGLGLGRGSPSANLGYGLVLFAVASLPWKLLLFVNALWPIGTGLGAWEDVRTAGWHGDVLILVLSRAVILPPLLEEPLARGYILARLRDGGWGVIGSVLLSALIFQLSHGHFYQTDPLVLGLFFCGLFAAICWAYATVQTGSILPAIVAHALGNVPEPSTLTGLGVLLAGMILLIVARRTPIAAVAGALAGDWRSAQYKRSLLIGLLATAAVMIGAALYRPLMPAIGAVALITVVASLRYTAGRPRFP